MATAVHKHCSTGCSQSTIDWGVCRAHGRRLARSCLQLLDRFDSQGVQQMFKGDAIPSWVQYPEVESVRWLNHLLKTLWSAVCVCAALCMLCLVLRSVCCVWCCALYAVSGAALCMLCLVLRSVCCVWCCALYAVSGSLAICHCIT